MTDRRAAHRDPSQWVKVWDPALRLFHWTLAAAFAVAYVTEGRMPVHEWAGYTILCLILLRIAWGFVGPQRARFGDFIHGPRRIAAHLRALIAGAEPRYLGHNPLGGLMVILLLSTLAATALSGIVLYGADAWEGPLGGVLHGMDEGAIETVEEVHELLGNTTLVLVSIHLAGVLWESLRHRENLAAAMLHGWKRV